jgi:hypothetical protein
LSELSRRISGEPSPEYASLIERFNAGEIVVPKAREPQNGRIRQAVVREMNRREWTSYALWKRARRTCPTLPQSAVYEFLAGLRAIGLEYVEAILAALDLQVTPAKSGRSKRRAA